MFKQKKQEIKTLKQGEWVEDIKKRSCFGTNQFGPKSVVCVYCNWYAECQKENEKRMKS